MNILSKISPREKNILLTGGIVLFLILTYQLITWYSDIRTTTDDYVETKRKHLEIQMTLISEKDGIQKEHEIVNSDLNELNEGLLSGNKPPVAAAEILRVLKKMTSSLGIDINLERTRATVDYGLYLGIPVEITFTAPTAKLKDLLYEIKTSSLHLTISEIKVRVKNINNPVDVNVNLIVKGLMEKSGHDKDKKDIQEK